MVAQSRTRKQYLPTIEGLFRRAQFGEAAKVAEVWSRISPSDQAAWNALGYAYHNSGKHFLATWAYSRSLEIKADQDGTVGNLGLAFREIPEVGKALVAHKRAVELQPRVAAHWSNLADTFRAIPEYSSALKAYEAALSLEPPTPARLFNKGQVLLSMGRYTDGWATYDSRWKLKGEPPIIVSGSRWRGERAANAVLLVWPEQGHGCAR